MSYPIRYAVEELKVDGGFEDDYEGVTKGYIVSKCYVLEKRLNYSNNDISYVVSFPYDNFEYFNNWYRNNKWNFNKYTQDMYKHYFEPRLDPSRERFKEEYPRHIVSLLFDTYEEAKEKADRKNGCLKGEILVNTGSAAYQKLLKEFEDTMDACGEYEKYIFANTDDMEITLDNIGYTYYKDSELIQKLLEGFEYNPAKKREILEKYRLLKQKQLVKKLTP